jgi:acetyl-CoA carboxylase carboxyl transferase subunit beta
MTWPEKKPPDGDAAEKKTLGKGVFRKCDRCGETLAAEAFTLNYEVCSHCGQHHKLSAEAWRRLLTDDGRVEEWDAHLEPADPLEFVDGKGYPERVAAAQKSMGSVAGEKVARLFERATAERLPVVLLHASGGARMQEGILSLMQMAKTVAALERLKEARLPFISVLLHPTTGGVAASFALLGDVNIAEPGALIGFAGPRVIESTIRQKLPDGFQRSEFLIVHGMVDRIVSRLDMKREIAEILGHLLPRGARAPAESRANGHGPLRG